MRLLPTTLRLPGVCAGCRQAVVFDGKRWTEPGSVRNGKRSSHICPQNRPSRRERMLCGAWMRRARERCARGAGHSGRDGHRTRWALDNALEAKTGHRIGA